MGDKSKGKTFLEYLKFQLVLINTAEKILENKISCFMYYFTYEAKVNTMISVKQKLLTTV